MIRGCGAIELQLANLPKEIRSSVDEVYVIGFVPVCLLPHQNLDPFFKPFLEEIKDIFINGLTIPISNPRVIGNITLPETMVIRVVLVLMTGNHPAQCETGKFLNQGKAGCRRCHLTGIHSQNPDNHRMYYGNSRRHVSCPFAKRKLTEEVSIMYQIEHEDQPTHKKKLFSHSRFTGMSLFYSYLNPLYGFDVLTDFVFDVFHTVPLNVVKNVLEALISNECFDLIKFDQLLSEFPWPPELKDGRIPGMIRKDRKGLSNWKGEQYLKFAFPLMECILDDLLRDSNVFEMTTISARIVQINFYCR